VRLVYAVLRFRRKPGRRASAGYHGNNALEIVWTLIPAVLMTVISIYSFQVPRTSAAVGDGSWSRSPAGSSPGVLLSSSSLLSELHPRWRDVRFQITSADVILVLDAGIPGGAMHAGQVSELLVRQIARPVPHPLCRTVRAGPCRHGGPVVVEGEPEFWRGWRACVRFADPVEAGRFLFQRYGCSTCHT
jgi:cytochrome c oxidase subunit 2